MNTDKIIFTEEIAIKSGRHQLFKSPRDLNIFFARDGDILKKDDMYYILYQKEWLPAFYSKMFHFYGSKTDSFVRYDFHALLD